MKSLDCLSNGNILLIYLYLYGAKIASLRMPSSEVTLVLGIVVV